MVAIGPRGIAVRYGGTTKPSVAWHEMGDARARGFVVTNARRRGEHTDETFRNLVTSRKWGCLLLEDGGECECEACKEAWKEEVGRAEKRATRSSQRGGSGAIVTSK